MSLSTLDSAAPARARVLAPLELPKVGKALHWISALLLLALFVSGIVMTQLGSGKLADTIFSAHKLVGVCALALLVVRIVYRMQARLRRRWPSRNGGRMVHGALYLVAILTPLLGWAGISDFGARTTLFGITLPSIWPEGLGYDSWLFNAHAYAAFGLIALVVLHIAIALQDFIMRGEAGMARPNAGSSAE